jgi:hypothetical protein
MLVGLITMPVQAFLDVGGRPLKIIYYGLDYIWVIDINRYVYVMALGASLTLELTHPRIKALVGFEYWPSDDEEDYNTFKLYFIWLALRWDWV